MYSLPTLLLVTEASCLDWGTPLQKIKDFSVWLIQKKNLPVNLSCSSLNRGVSVSQDLERGFYLCFPLPGCHGSEGRCLKHPTVNLDINPVYLSRAMMSITLGCTQQYQFSFNRTVPGSFWSFGRVTMRDSFNLKSSEDNNFMYDGYIKMFKC